MPDLKGKLQFQDYDAALVARGFDGFEPDERKQMINAAYRYIARKFPWTWKEGHTTNISLAPGTYTISVSGSLSAFGAQNIEKAYIVTDPYRKKLALMDSNIFDQKWLPMDLTAVDSRGIPNWYYVFDDKIYILPAPSVQLFYLIYFKDYLPDMWDPTDVPATPSILDEVILDAALVRAHRRAHELELAQDAQIRVNEALDDMLTDDSLMMLEQQERVLPDDQWL